MANTQFALRKSSNIVYVILKWIIRVFGPKFLCKVETWWGSPGVIDVRCLIWIPAITQCVKFIIVFENPEIGSTEKHGLNLIIKINTIRRVRYKSALCTILSTVNGERATTVEIHNDPLIFLVYMYIRRCQVVI